jgi:hypothetical protein
MSGTAPAVFLSYRREETRHIAGRLADRLTERLGSTQIFIDVDTIEPGSDFTATIVREVASCDVLIALIGPTWLTITDPRAQRRLDDPDDLVTLEIRTALEYGIRVIPVLVDGAVMPSRYELPEGLQGLALRNAVRLDHETFRTDVVTLLDAVERALLNFPQKPAEPTVGTDDRIIDRARTGRDRSAPAGIGATFQRWIANVAAPASVDTAASRLLTKHDGDGLPKSRKLLTVLVGIVLLVVGGLLAMLISLTPTDGSASQSTTTVLTTSPASPLHQGSPVALTATVTPATATGILQFKDGSTNLSKNIVRNGTASALTSRLAMGSHSLTAIFVPSDPAAFGPSSSPSVPFVIIAPNGAVITAPDRAKATSTALTASPASPVTQGTRVTLTATITPVAVAGGVQFKDGVTNLGDPVPVSNGTASGSTPTLSVGSHQLSAVFTPSNPTAFGPSTSPAVNVTVTPQG